MNKLRNLLVAGINKLLEEKLIQLDHSPVKDGYLLTELFGKTSVIQWADIGHEEVRVSVWWDYDHDKHPQANKEGNARESFTTSSPLAKSQHYPKFVGAFASGWLERKNGYYLQGKGSEGIFDTYVRRTAKDDLAKLPEVEPRGFKAEGRFHM